MDGEGGKTMTRRALELKSLGNRSIKSQHLTSRDGNRRTPAYASLSRQKKAGFKDV